MNLASYTHLTRKPGDIVWAFSYSGENRTHGQKLRQKPVKGMLLSYKYEDSDINPNGPCRFFVPFGKNDKPSWSKVVNAYSRYYADTEQDAIDGYNMEIQRLIQENLDAIHAAEKDLILTGQTKIQSRPQLRTNIAIADSVITRTLAHGEPLPDTAGTVMTWDDFIHGIEHKHLTDNDGRGILIIDGTQIDNLTLRIATKIADIHNQCLIPFESIPDVLAGHTIQVLWQNK